MSVAHARERPPQGQSDLASVRVADCGDAAAWERFLDSRSDGSMYLRYGWKDINERILRHRTHYLAAYEGQQICGVLPLVEVSSRLFGRILCSMPFLNQGGPCATTPEVAKTLCEAAMHRASTLGVDYLELRSPCPIDVALPVSLRKVNMPVNLMADPDALFNSFSKSHRRNLRRAYKEGLEVRSGGIEMFDAFRTVIERLWRDLGTPLYTASFFREVLVRFPERTRVFAVYRGEIPVAAMLVGYSNGIAESMWGGSRPEYRHLDANYVLYWEMIKDACEKGLRVFNLGRSTVNSGGTQFKLKWNAQPEQQHWYFFRPDGGEMPQLNVDNPKYRLAISTWRRLPLWVTRLIGPPVARLIP